VIINDSRNRILFANSIFLRMIGLTAEQLLGRTVTELFPPEDIEVLLRRQTEGHGLYEFYLLQPGGLRQLSGIVRVCRVGSSSPLHRSLQRDAAPDGSVDRHLMVEAFAEDQAPR
jgi:PAS domain-containing protein